ncbi:MAG: 50S ribosomal protein L20 [bacterium]|nr:50S ribosomal protein L20 [bacterium]
MTRVKTGIIRRRRHKKILKAAKGYRMTRHRLYKVAHEAVLHAGQYAFAGRKLRKRQFRRLWITRLNIALRQVGTKYSEFINKLKKQNINLNRKTLSEMAVNQPEAFKKLVQSITAHK